MGSIKLIIYDFDGVMTDNKVYVDQNGNESVNVNRADGLGVSEIKKLGLQQFIVSTETNPVVSARARKLGLPCLQGIENKSLEIASYSQKNHISLDTVAYVGNDINDMEAMKMVGTTFCPADAHEKIKNISDHVLSTKGGDGVVREILEFLLDRYNSN